MLLYGFLYFLTFFVIFYHKICVIIIFICFSDVISNLCNRILTNQEQELFIRNCQWICMLWKCDTIKSACFHNPLVNIHLNSSFLLVAEIIKYFKTVLSLNLFGTNVSILEKPMVVLHWQIVWKTPVEMLSFKFRSMTHISFTCHFSTCVSAHFWWCKSVKWFLHKWNIG